MHTFLTELLDVADRWPDPARIHHLGNIRHGNLDAPLMGFSIGSTDPLAPTLGFIGGIHGVEKIGSEVALAIQSHLIARFRWDRSLKNQLEQMRLIFYPVVNPIGVMRLTRSNGNGVDLMRNAPVVSPQASWMVGGQEHSPMIPWFRGYRPHTAERMEPELKALENFVRSQTSESRCSLLIDLHSGFGMKDQLWFPFAKSTERFPRLPQVLALKELLDEALPHHVYRFEPQSKHYCTHGDLWDYLLEEQLRDPKRDKQMFLPMTLEMGSWSWIKKNPLQLFTYRGTFNPIKPHRHKRILRRHLPLFDFLMSAVLSHEVWSQQADIRRLARPGLLEDWYGGA